MKNWTRNTENDAEDGKNELWQRQKDVLMQLTNAENLYYEGERLQSPLYDQMYGNKRNLYSVRTMLTACRQILKIVGPQITDEKTEDNKKPHQGINSNKFRKYEVEMIKAQDLINNSLRAQTAHMAEIYLNKSFITIDNVFNNLRQEINNLGYDFRAKKSVYDAWKE